MKRHPPHRPTHHHSLQSPSPGVCRRRCVLTTLCGRVPTAARATSRRSLPPAMARAPPAPSRPRCHRHQHSPRVSWACPAAASPSSDSALLFRVPWKTQRLRTMFAGKKKTTPDVTLVPPFLLPLQNPLARGAAGSVPPPAPKPRWEVSLTPSKAWGPLRLPAHRSLEPTLPRACHTRAQSKSPKNRTGTRGLAQFTLPTWHPAVRPAGPAQVTGRLRPWMRRSARKRTAKWGKGYKNGGLRTRTAVWPPGYPGSAAGICPVTGGEVLRTARDWTARPLKPVPRLLTEPKPFAVQDLPAGCPGAGPSVPLVPATGRPRGGSGFCHTGRARLPALLVPGEAEAVTGEQPCVLPAHPHRRRRTARRHPSQVSGSSDSWRDLPFFWRSGIRQTETSAPSLLSLAALSCWRSRRPLRSAGQKQRHSLETRQALPSAGLVSHLPHLPVRRRWPGLAVAQGTPAAPCPVLRLCLYAGQRSALTHTAN